MKEAFNLSSKLFIITAVAAIVLALLNSATEPIIEARAEEELQNSLAIAFPGGSEFVPLGQEGFKAYVDEKSPIKEVYDVDSGQGYVYLVESKGGYGGPIKFIVGIKDQETLGFSVLSHSETPGFGAAITEEGYDQGITGVNTSGEVGYNLSPADNEIQAISGSTITTKCISNGINAAASLDRELNK